MLTNKALINKQAAKKFSFYFN